MEQCNDSDIVTVTTTVARPADAQALARAILDARLAACVQVDAGLTSFYRWEGRLCEEPELRLTLKTLPACLGPLRALFAERHPYDLPQFVVLPGSASAAYADWVRAEVAPAAGLRPAGPGRTPAR